MLSRPSVRVRPAPLFSASLAGIGIALLSCAPAANARVTQIVIKSVESPTFGGKTFGALGAYERISGQVIGEVDPNDRRNAIIVDIGLAPKNPNGTVSYSTDFQILRPIDRAKGNRRLLYEITNRGRTNALETLNDSKVGNDVETSGEAGNGFLMRQGYVLLESGWDVPAPGGKSFAITVPVAKNADGSPITGPATEEFVIDKGQTPPRQRLNYPAASPDKSKASLTVRKNYADTPIPVPESDWDYADAKLNAVKLTSGNFGGPGSFGPTALYEFTYIARDPTVVGLGFAAIRDLATFLRTAKADDQGVANPLAGDVQFIYTFCSSQPCRTMHDFLQLGFNEAEGTAGAKTFDGILNWKAGGSGIFMNYRFGQPVRTHRQHIARWTPEYQFPFADQKMTDTVTGKTDSRLRRCEESKTCPKIFEANSSNEYWAKAASMMQTDSQGHDLAGGLDNVRYYLLASFPHGAGNGRGICAQPRNTLRPNQALRALLVDLDAWVTEGEAPPKDHMPRAADGTLAPPLPQAGMGFPQIPGVTYNGVHHTGDLFDFGPSIDKGILSVLPPKLLGSPYPVLVPKTDADGNDVAGIRMPEVAVPVATYTGWALRADGLDGCDAAGQQIALPKTKAERMASGDPRPSLEERYADHATYVSQVTRAAQELKAQRLMLDEDVAATIAAAQAASVP
ncbi:MAG TPA: alpha/beta hydrolase domain-containing protein [Xanthobacteraceae bacterium]